MRSSDTSFGFPLEAWCPKAFVPCSRTSSHLLSYIILGIHLQQHQHVYTFPRTHLIFVITVYSSPCCTWDGTHVPPKARFYANNHHCPLTTPHFGLYKHSVSSSLRLRAFGPFVTTEKISMAPALRMTCLNQREATVFFCVLFGSWCSSYLHFYSYSFVFTYAFFLFGV
jgi:hypothetical protein